MQAYDVSLSSDDTNAKEQASENAAALRITLKREPVTPPGDGFFTTIFASHYHLVIPQKLLAMASRVSLKPSRLSNDQRQ